MLSSFFIITPRTMFFLAAFGAFFILQAEQHDNKANKRLIINCNTDWLFLNKPKPDGYTINCNESQFVPVCVPHTVSIAPHAKIDTSIFAKVSWYRKHLFIADTLKNKKVFLEFEGISKVAEVYVNGQMICEHKGAYTPFTVDISCSILTGKDNIVAVKVDSRQRKDIPPEGINVDYMIGGGIVRNVNIIVTDLLYLENVFAFKDTAEPSQIKITALVKNSKNVSQNCFLRTVISDTSGVVVATAQTEPQTIAANSDFTFSYKTGSIDNIHTWHPDHPYLYSVHTKVFVGSLCTDDIAFEFGIRSISFNKTSGIFSINGHPLKLLGLNRHETFPFIGRAAADRLQRKVADILKYDLGCNIVRCSHYPQSTSFLNRCDEIGLMVLEETPGWIFVSEAKQWQALVLKNLEDMIVRDRNHASVISYGVRINESADFHKLYVATNACARKLDPTRPTHGVRVLDRGYKNEFLEDVWAQNFAIPSGKPPVLPWITTESVGSFCSAHSFDNEDVLMKQLFCHAAVHDSVAANPYIAGLLGWAAFDYNSPYKYAKNQVCYHGVEDIFRIQKPAAYFYASQRDPALYGPMVYIANYWKQYSKMKDIWVTSNCDLVELFVNNISLGKIAPNRYMHLPHPLFVWNNVAFEKGELKAVGYRDQTAIVSFVRKTPEKPFALAMAADDTVLALGGDMTRVVVTALDKQETLVPKSDNTVVIEIKGPGDFLGESPILLEDGKTCFYVKTRAHESGIVVCNVRSDKLKGAECRIIVK